MFSALLTNEIKPDPLKSNAPATLRVALLGFDSVEKERLVRLLQTERSGARQYQIASATEHAPIHLLLVNYDNPSALTTQAVLIKSHPKITLVAISRGPVDNPPAHHIRGLLIAAKVFSVLDQIVVEFDAAQPTQISLPTAPSTEPVKDSPLAVPPSVVQDDGYRVLVVDDSPAIQKSLELNLATLPNVGSIDFAETGEGALEKAESQHYDLIFLDVMMPGMDGYEACTRLRKKPEYKKTPIIMVSGKTSPLDEVKGVMAGCTTYLTKPVQAEAFQKLSIRVLAWLEKNKQH